MTELSKNTLLLDVDTYNTLQDKASLASQKTELKDQKIGMLEQQVHDLQSKINDTQKVKIIKKDYDSYDDEYSNQTVGYIGLEDVKSDIRKEIEEEYKSKIDKLTEFKKNAEERETDIRKELEKRVDQHREIASNTKADYARSITESERKYSTLQSDLEYKDSEREKKFQRDRETWRTRIDELNNQLEDKSIDQTRQKEINVLNETITNLKKSLVILAKKPSGIIEKLFGNLINWSLRKTAIKELIIASSEKKTTWFGGTWYLWEPKGYVNN